MHRHLCVFVFVSTLLFPLSAGADGGFVRASAATGPFIVTVFTAPTPLRAGLADISVLVQEREAKTPVLDAQVSVRLQRADERTPPITAAATRQQATNKLLYAALVTIPEAGSWDAQVTISRAAERAAVHAALDVEEARRSLWMFWPYLAVPPVTVALFVLHQWLGSDGGKKRTHSRVPVRALPS